MKEEKLLNTREVARFLNINEKMVYSLIAEKGLPATKITGKWLFPRHLVAQWVENQTINFPGAGESLPPYHGLLIFFGSNDILLDRAISKFNQTYKEHMAVFGNAGSLGGIRSLRRGLCHIATSHLLDDNEEEYNFGYLKNELERLPAIINFCRREQGLILAKGNPKGIEKVEDLLKAGIKVVNRPLSTGTRLLFDKEIKKAKIDASKIEGYPNEYPRHLDVGLEVLSGRADAAPGIRAVAGMLGLDFISWRWERFDLLVNKERFFEKGVQSFLGFLNEKPFRELGPELEGYDLSLCSKMVFQGETAEDKEE
jgi:excisionase family DNA binding protein